MNKQFVLNDNLFFFDGNYYAVDKGAEIKTGDWYWAFSAQAGIGYKHFQCDDEYSVANEMQVPKIIFSTNPSLGLPFLLLFSAAETLLENNAAEYQKNQHPSDARGNEYACFKAGYKSNPAKFTEQDMVEFTEWCSEKFDRTYPTQKVYAHDSSDSLWFPKITWDGKLEKRIYLTKELFDIFKSKEKSVKSFEVEMEEYTDFNDDINCETKDIYVAKHRLKINSLGQIAPVNVKYKMVNE